MYTVNQVATYLSVSNTTIRNLWAPEFADYLSPTANPEKGETRLYSEDDVVILQTVAVLRQQQKSYDDIRHALESGTRLEIDHARPIDDPRSADASNDLTLTVQAFQETLQRYESRLDKMQSELNDKTNQLIDAEKRASIAEMLSDDKDMLQAEIESLRAKNESLQAELNQEKGKTFWQRLTGKK